MQQSWRRTTLLLATYGLVKEIRPSEPFLTEYLISNTTGVTAQQVKPTAEHTEKTSGLFGKFGSHARVDLCAGVP